MFDLRHQQRFRNKAQAPRIKVLEGIPQMNNDKPTVRGGTSVAGVDDDEVERLAKKVGISVGAVRELIRQYGNNRASLERRAWKLKGK